MKNKYLKLLILIILTSVSLIIIFSNLNTSPIQQWDERTNISVVNSSRNTFPFLKDGQNNFFEKPPLWYWANISLTSILGNDTQNYRIISAFSFILIISIVFFLCFKEYGFYSAIVSWIVLISSFQLLFPEFKTVFSTHSFKSADSDSFMILLCITTTFFIYLSFTKNRKFLIIAGLSTGLGIMTKGLIALIPLISFLLYLLISKKYFSKKIILLSILIAFVISVPWHIAAFIQFGNIFIDKYFIYHNIKRISQTLEDHKGSIFFYLKVLSNPQIFLYFPLFILSFLQTGNKNKFKTNFLAILTLINICLYFTLITLAQTKLAWYDLYLYPFMAIFIASYVNDLKINKNISKLFK